MAEFITTLETRSEAVPKTTAVRPAVALRTTGDAQLLQASVRDFYDDQGPCTHTGWRQYYYRRLQRRMAAMVEPHSRILDIGCGDGTMLASLSPSVGVGIDLSKRVVQEARRKHTDLRFIQMAGEDVHELGDTFDYIVVAQTLGEIYDLGVLLQSVKSVCHARTRILVAHYSRLWQPVLKSVEWLRLKKATPERNWLPADEVQHLLKLSGFETIGISGMTVMPFYIPLISNLLNKGIANLPGMDQLGFNYIIQARPVHSDIIERSKPRSVSIVIPARNEAGHIKQLLDRIPVIAPRQQIIFVEGHSTDDTWQVIQDEVAAYQGPFDVLCMQQDGAGKGDAVRKGFAVATGDALMILDADISVPPEELPSFFAALTSGQGEFINGSRMVYLMDKRAMRFLNLLGNKLFGAVFTYLLSQRFRDTLCGTKVLLRSDYERIAANRSYFGNFDPFGDFDLLFGASKLNLKIVDVPVHYKARTYGETNISRFRHGLILLRMCLFAARKLKFV